jgi:hypothetical protein
VHRHLRRVGRRQDRGVEVHHAVGPGAGG